MKNEFSHQFTVRINFSDVKIFFVKFTFFLRTHPDRKKIPTQKKFMSMFDRQDKTN